MAKINILEPAVYNKISAGEVVERPASVVKELIENSIDAGATKISISIQSGGIKNITVIDNGCGISKDDLVNAFAPHATSKIKSQEDLETIFSLGFRGEALASIASVSMVTLRSKTCEEELGAEINIDGGEVKNITDIGSSDGSSISVSNLFFNTPARAKFLKKPKFEESEITNLVARFILINHSIAIKYEVDGEMVFNTNGTGLFDAITIVYGASTSKNLIPLNREYNGFSLEGFIGVPLFSKPNKTYQTISLNGRYIINSTIASSIHSVYAEFMMKRNYPFYVLNLKIDPSKIDVNVHPTKMDVRFENNSEIYSFFLHAIKYAVEKYNKDKAQNFINDNTDENIVRIMSVNNESCEQPLIITNSNEQTSFEHSQSDIKVKDEHAFLNNNNTYNNWNKTPQDILKEVFSSKLELNDCNTTGDLVKQGGVMPSKQQSFYNLQPHSEQKIQESFDLPLSYKVIGQIFNTYILVENEDNLLIIDQHAGHERLLYDKIIESYENKENLPQSLLVPYVFTVNHLENEFFKSQIVSLQAIGFGIEEFGDNAFKVSHVPFHLAHMDIKKFIDDILADVSIGKKIKTTDNIKEHFMSVACKSAIKAGKRLEPSEIEYLIHEMKSGSVLQCPHGRPIIYAIPKQTFEKWFKRIV